MNKSKFECNQCGKRGELNFVEEPQSVPSYYIQNKRTGSEELMYEIVGYRYECLNCGNPIGYTRKSEEELRKSFE